MRIWSNCRLMALVVAPMMAAVLVSIVPAYADDILPAVGKPPSAVEGIAIVNGQIGSFTDLSNPSTPASSFSATINWGDGSISAATIASNGSGGFNILGNHTYADDLPGIIVTTTLNENGAFVFSLNMAPFNVQEAETLTGTPFVATAGQVFGGQVASFTDLNSNNTASDFTALINWGDGSISPGTISGGAGLFDISGSHTYAFTGPFVVTAALKLDGIGDDTVATTTDVGSASVPEPSSLLLLGTGLVGMATAGLRRKRHA